MMSAPSPIRPGVLERLWIYQAERFPLGKAAILMAAFTSASLSFSAVAAGRPLPGAWTFLALWLVTLLVFFQLRASDEVKDRDDDARYRPERPIPRGLVSLRLITGLALACVPMAAALAASVSPAILGLLGLVWVWLALMSAEFFVPARLKARPLAYLVSHMAIMPLIDLFVTSGEWLARGHQPPPALTLFLLLSFLNGCILEIGRKIVAPEQEREGVETYSGLWGPNRAAGAWIALVGASWAVLAGAGAATGSGAVVAALGSAAAAYAVATAIAFMKRPGPQTQKRLDTAAGLWVFACYMVAGFAPLVVRSL